ncbi:MAG: hypothetical protein M1816_000525, partial [Peltula sp. TS41687]
MCFNFIIQWACGHSKRETVCIPGLLETVLPGENHPQICDEERDRVNKCPKCVRHDKWVDKANDWWLAIQKERGIRERAQNEETSYDLFGRPAPDGAQNGRPTTPVGGFPVGPQDGRPQNGGAQNGLSGHPLPDMPPFGRPQNGGAQNGLLGLPLPDMPPFGRPQNGGAQN